MFTCINAFVGSEDLKTVVEKRYDAWIDTWEP